MNWVKSHHDFADVYELGKIIMMKNPRWTEHHDMRAKLKVERLADWQIRKPKLNFREAKFLQAEDKSIGLTLEKVASEQAQGSATCKFRTWTKG